ncbi:endonuclease, point mutation [Bifidobacterium anseris]|uniref:Endonuclease, point mutation n=1 Tax=Bifidobacterium anseris TaxID=2020963 RepID=A0A2N5IYI2_9BIFI|nr:AAA family ATPase [Bifidobacterium anseris]PLS27021.1 endonuclease, point mutation [Bifidobacterium anseris]
MTVSIKENIEKADLNHTNLIFHGAPGTGKTFGVLKAVTELIDGKEYGADFTQEMMVERLRAAQSDDRSRFRFVQFHPSYDYTDFVEGLRPNPKGNGFSLQAGTFMEFCANARNDQNNRYYFIIDEINRGDVSNIFGELFFLLDGGYREVGIDTQYANMHQVELADGETFAQRYLDGGKFTIPENVTIIGTMNDIDRSVDSFDFAMRRRFNFINISAENSREMREDFDITTNSYQKMAKLMDAINKEIRETDGLGESYELGASYFQDLAKAANNDPEEYNKAKAETWENRVKPLLTEYLRGSTDDNALGRFSDIWYKSGISESDDQE